MVLRDVYMSHSGDFYCEFVVREPSCTQVFLDVGLSAYSLYQIYALPLIPILHCKQNICHVLLTLYLHTYVKNIGLDSSTLPLAFLPKGG